MKRILFFLGIMSVSTGALLAQQPVSVLQGTKDTVLERRLKSIFVNPGMTYISNLTYVGRKGIAATPVLTPYVNLIHKMGFFLSSVGYVNTAKGHWGLDGLSISPGYVHHFGPHFNGYISGAKYLIGDSSSLILASIKGSVDAGLTFSSKLLNVGATADYIIGHQGDFLAGGDVSKDITAKLSKRASLKISPTASFMAGTQSFYQTYYVNSITKRRVPSGPASGRGPLGGLLGGGQQGSDSTDVITSVVTQEKQSLVREFRPLNINFYVPVYLYWGKCQFNFTPNVSFPFSEGSADASSPQNKPFFFYTVGASLVL